MDMSPVLNLNLPTAIIYAALGWLANKTYDNWASSRDHDKRSRDEALLQAQRTREQSFLKEDRVRDQAIEKLNESVALNTTALQRLSFTMEAVEKTMGVLGPSVSKLEKDVYEIHMKLLSLGFPKTKRRPDHV